MKTFPADASDEQILRAIDEWVALLADERYEDAYAFLYHPYLPEFPVNELDTDTIRLSIVEYGPNQLDPDAASRVTPAETAAPKDVPNYKDVRRYEGSAEADWDQLRTTRGGAATGDRMLGYIHYDLPVNGQWSDLTAIFEIVLHDAAVVLCLQGIDVL